MLRAGKLTLERAVLREGELLVTVFRQWVTLKADDLWFASIGSVALSLSGTGRNDSSRHAAPWAFLCENPGRSDSATLSITVMGTPRIIMPQSC